MKMSNDVSGLPKAAIVTHERFIRAGSLMKIIDGSPEDIIYTALPLYHTAAIAIAMGACLQSGIYSRFLYLYIFRLPKAAIVTHERFLRSGCVALSLFDGTSQDIIYTVLPLYHFAACAVGMGACFHSDILTSFPYSNKHFHLPFCTFFVTIKNIFLKGSSTLTWHSLKTKLLTWIPLLSGIAFLMRLGPPIFFNHPGYGTIWFKLLQNNPEEESHVTCNISHLIIFDVQGPHWCFERSFQHHTFGKTAVDTMWL